MSFFDKYQKIITVVGIASFSLSLIFMIWNSASAIPIYDEEGIFTGYEYATIPQTLYSIFVFLNILCGAWFLARLVTFKMRLKEDK